MSTRKPTERRRVLVVDHDPRSLALLKMLLGAQGHDVMGAGDAAQALALAVRFLPRLLILDLDLPGGPDLVRQLQAGAETRGVEVVALTVRAPDDVAGLVRDLGCRALLPKPVTAEHFLAQVERYL